MTQRLEELKAALADRYEIERELGRGGMATVYLAHDIKHQREVAIKVLRPDLAAALGPERFQREIRIAANLTHPHILPLHDSGEAEGFLYYVMPYIEGQTLRDRIEKEGELPVTETVRIIREVVDALAFAHSKGVVHRDIKPDNVMLIGGHAIVADFGVAKAVSEATGRDKLTTAGVALGTPAYMAPEQATADPHVDHRADIYAVGAVAYELLAGRTPFTGATPQSILAAHVTEQVDPVSKHRDHVSAELEAVIMKCLEKKPADRWQSADELLPHLETLVTSSGGLTPTATMPVPAVSGVKKYLSPAVIAGVLALVVVGFFGIRLLKPEPFTITTSNIRQITRDPGLELDPALSPDGSDVVYSAGPPLKTQLYVRGLGEMATTVQLAQDLQGSQRYAQWNPDGESVFFCLSEPCQPRQVGKMGGAVRPIGDAENLGTQIAISPDGSRIVFSRRFSDSILIRPVAGGNAELLAIAPTPGRSNSSFAWSPDGNSIAFMEGNDSWHRSGTLGNVLSSQIWIVDVGSGELAPVTDAANMDLSPQWLPDGRHLLFVSDMDGPRDIYVVEVGPGGALGNPQRVTSGGADPHSISVSADGSRLAYSKFTFRRNIWSVAIPRSGSISITEAEPVTTGNQVIESHGLSPDENWIAYDANLQGKQGIYKMPIEGGDPIPLATGSENFFAPRWSPDGTEVVAYTGSGPPIWVISADGSNREQVMPDNGWFEPFVTWSPDGLELAFFSTRAGIPGSIWITSRDRVGGEWGEPVRLTYDLLCVYPTWDPDGAGIACAGDGQIQLVTRSGDVRTLLTASDADLSLDVLSPIFSPDGSIIYFVAVDQSLTQGVWSIPATGGEPRLVVSVDDPSLLLYRTGVSIGAEKLYLSVAEYESDIWVMDLEW